jgi:hypothetical protein
MPVESDIIGVIRDHRWVEVGDQRKRLQAYGCRKMLDLSKGNELGAGQPDLLRLAGPGRTFVLVHAFLLADPKAMRKRGGMKASFDATLKAIEARGSVVRDLETGLTTETKEHRKAVVAVSHSHISRASRGERSALNGKMSQGRPPKWDNPEHRQVMWEEWHSTANRTNVDAAKEASRRIGKYVSPNTMWKTVKVMRAERGMKGKGASGRRPHSAAAALAAKVGSPSEAGRPPIPKAPAPKQGVVYFIRNGVRDRVKIGFSENHKVRLSSLQGASPDALMLIGTLPGTVKFERRMHERFKAYREKGEWFRVEGKLATFLKTLRKPQKG